MELVSRRAARRKPAVKGLTRAREAQCPGNAEVIPRRAYDAPLASVGVRSMVFFNLPIA
jgi:hypothetical protein